MAAAFDQQAFDELVSWARTQYSSEWMGQFLTRLDDDRATNPMFESLVPVDEYDPATQQQELPEPPPQQQNVTSRRDLDHSTTTTTTRDEDRFAVPQQLMPHVVKYNFETCRNTYFVSAEWERKKVKLQGELIDWLIDLYDSTQNPEVTGK